MNPTDRDPKAAPMRPTLASTQPRAQPLPESAPKSAHEDPAAPEQVGAARGGKPGRGKARRVVRAP